MKIVFFRKIIRKREELNEVKRMIKFQLEKSFREKKGEGIEVIIQSCSKK